MFYNKLKMDSVAEEVAKIISVEESYDDEDDDVAKADRELARMKAKPIPAAKINTDKDKIKKTAKDKEEEMDESTDVPWKSGIGVERKHKPRTDAQAMSVAKNLAGKGLKGAQHKLDVAEPKGKLTGADFKKLRKEESEQIDERTLTSGESKEKEHYVKSMKKNLKGFKSRYGERAKDVMYATATKMAKEDVDLLDDVIEFMQTEEYAQLDELSKKTLANYMRANTKRMADPKNTDSMEKKMKRHDDYFKASKKFHEESEQIDELSKKTLTNYVNKSTASANKSFGLASNAAQRSKSAADTKQFMKHSEKFGKRSAGIEKANARLNKEESEQIDELSVGKLDAYRKKAIKSSGASSTVRQVGIETADDKIKQKTGTYHPSMMDKIKSKIRSEEVVNENYGDMPHAAKELVLHADNDHHLHFSSHQPIVKNLSKKMKKGTYHPEKAKKLWQYHADRAAQSYAKHHGDGTPWHKMFSVSDRKHAAAHWEDMHRHELNEAKGPTSDYSLNSTFAQEASTPIARVKQAAHSAMKRIKDKLGMQNEVLGKTGTSEEVDPNIRTTETLKGCEKGGKVDVDGPKGNFKSTKVKFTPGPK